MTGVCIYVIRSQMIQERGDLKWQILSRILNPSELNTLQKHLYELWNAWMEPCCEYSPIIGKTNLNVHFSESWVFSYTRHGTLYLQQVHSVWSSPKRKAFLREKFWCVKMSTELPICPSLVGLTDFWNSLFASHTNFIERRHETECPHPIHSSDNKKKIRSKEEIYVWETI